MIISNCLSLLIIEFWGKIIPDWVLYYLTWLKEEVTIGKNIMQNHRDQRSWKKLKMILLNKNKKWIKLNNKRNKTCNISMIWSKPCTRIGKMEKRTKKPISKIFWKNTTLLNSWPHVWTKSPIRKKKMSAKELTYSMSFWKTISI